MNTAPIDLVEATSRKKHAEFERYFEKWDKASWERTEQEIGALTA